MKRNIFVNPDIGNTLKKFTMYFSVFFLVFGLTMIIRNAGDTFAYTNADCPTGWTYDDGYKRCKYYSKFSVLDDCIGQIDKDLGFHDDSDDEGRNFCVILNSGETNYTAFIHPDDYAYTQRKDCKVTFFDMKGSAVPDKTVKCGESITLPSVSEISGFDFKGWCNDSLVCESKDALSPGTKVTIEDDITFGAKWEENGQPIKHTYMATFKPNEGNLIGNVDTKSCDAYDDGSCIVSGLPSAERDGFIFKGWGETTLCTNGKIDELELDRSRVYYACWQADDISVKRTVKFVANGGKFKYLSTDLVGGELKIFVNDGNPVITIAESDTTNTISKEGHSLKGWTVLLNSDNTPNCSSVIKGGVETSAVTNDITYYACWTDNSSDDNNENNPNSGENTPTVTEYNVTFELNGGKLYENDAESSSLVRKLSSLDYSKYTAKKENNTFNGWSTASACTNPVKTGTLKLENDITLYACYTENEVDDGNKDDGEVTNKTYKVTFNLDDGDLYKSGKKNTKTVWELSNIKYTDYTAKKDGHTFKGWSKDKECSKIVGTSEKVTEDMILWACYDKDETKPSKPSTPDNPTNDKTEDEVDKNQQTGRWFVYMVLILGAVALGYAGYNAYKYSEVRK